MPSMSFRYRHMVGWGLCGVLIGSALIYAMFSLGIVGKRDREIAGGYHLFSDGWWTTCLMTPEGMPTHPSQPCGGVAVAAKITSVGVAEKYIVGHVVSSPNSVMGDIETPGYFFVNSGTGEVMSSLSLEQCVEALRQHGHDMPRLKRAQPIIGW